MASSAPIRSTFRGALGSRDSGTRATSTISTNAASGRLIKNTARQENVCASAPPSTGPIAVVIALNPDHVPIARPRSAPEKFALISARLPGVASAPPTP